MVFLAVVIDQIWPPNKIKNRRNKHNLHIYVITLTYFDLYFKIIILLDIYMNTVEKVTKIHFLTKRRRETRREAHLPSESGQNTSVAMAQPTSGTDHAKTVERGANLGVVALGVRPHPYHRLLGPLDSGGCMMPCRGSFAWFPFLPQPKPTILGYK
jgi:hypothetical protein